MSEMINCGTHGQQPETFICKHILRSLKTGTEVGFYWSVEDGAYDAVCEKCNDLSDEQWQKRAPELIQVICLGCFKVAAGHNGVEVGEVV